MVLNKSVPSDHRSVMRISYKTLNAVMFSELHGQYQSTRSDEQCFIFAAYAQVQLFNKQQGALYVNVNLSTYRDIMYSIACKYAKFFADGLTTIEINIKTGEYDVSVIKCISCKQFTEMRMSNCSLLHILDEILSCR